jgi:hypothetical protein
MKKSFRDGLGCFVSSLAVFAALTASADNAAPPFAAAQPLASDSPANPRYGLFDGLDHRSQYGVGVFPEPFIVDDSDLEVNEFRLDWQHTRLDDTHSDLTTVEVEKGFGELTVELEVHYERDVEGTDVTKGFDNVDLGARYPLYQYVSQNGFFDTTFGIGFEMGIPTESALGKNAESVPKVFNDLILGNFTLQSIVGWSHLFGPGDDGGLDTFEYGFVAGFTIQHDNLPIPGVMQLIPVFEMSAETALNNGESGHNSMIGNLAVRVNLKSIWHIQPRLGVGYIFPINDGARQEVRNGVFTSLVFEY